MMARPWKLGILTLIFLNTLSLSLWAVDWAADNYQDYTTFIENLYAIDPNAGQSTLPILNIPSGGRGEAMGNAYSSMGEDGLSLEWNPALSTSIAETGLSVYHNNWIADSKVETITYTTREDFWGTGIGGKWLYTEFTQYNDVGARLASSYYMEGMAWLNGSMRLFPGYYFWGLALGANLKGAFRISPNWADATGQIIANSGASQSGIMGMADIGLGTKLNVLKFYRAQDYNTAFSLVLKNLGPALYGDPLPTNITAGLAWRPIRPLLIAFDFIQPINIFDIQTSEKPQFSLGLSGQLSSFLAIRTGVFIRPAQFRISMGATISFQKADLDLSYSLDQLTQFRSFNRLSLAVNFKLGDKGRGNRAMEVKNYYLNGLNEYAAGNFELAYGLWEEALLLDKSFDPAREGIKAIDNSKALEKRIEDIQSLN